MMKWKYTIPYLNQQFPDIKLTIFQYKMNNYLYEIHNSPMYEITISGHGDLAQHGIVSGNVSGTVLRKDVDVENNIPGHIYC